MSNITRFLRLLCWALLVTIAALLALCLPACTPLRTVATFAHPAAVDSLAARGPRVDTALAALPPYLVPAPAGSSPAQRRQWQRAQAQNLARAGVGPQKIKNSSLATAPGAVAVNRPGAPVATGGSTATDARKGGTRGGSLAVGPGAVARATSGGTPLWVYFLVAVCGAVAWEWLTCRLVPLKWLPWRALLP